MLRQHLGSGVVDKLNFLFVAQLTEAFANSGKY
jgi:hypothetical protein